MEESFVRKRISSLRVKKGVSEYKMSLDIGHSKSYIQSISSGRALPSLSELLYICDYFGITPMQFFDEGMEFPVLTNQLLEATSSLDDEDLKILLSVAKRLSAKPQQK